MVRLPTPRRARSSALFNGGAAHADKLLTPKVMDNFDDAKDPLNRSNGGRDDYHRGQSRGARENLDILTQTT